MRPSPRVRLLPLLFGALLVSCSTGGIPRGATAVATQVVVAGCSMCMFRDEPFRGCFWAVEIDGARYLLDGPAFPPEHDTHGPEGMCSVKREATIEGWIEGDRFQATRFDLLPFEAGKHPQPDGPAH